MLKRIALCAAVLVLAGASSTYLGGALNLIGGFPTIFRVSAATDVTFPTSGRLAVATGQLGMIGKLTAANMNSTADQPITISGLQGASGWVAGGTATVATSIGFLVTNCNGTASTAGGALYLGAGKTSALTAVTTLSSLTGSAATMQRVPLSTGGSTTQTATTVYFALTTPQGSAVTCDVYVMGVPLP